MGKAVATYIRQLVVVVAVTDGSVGYLALFEAVFQLVHDENVLNGFMGLELTQGGIQALQEGHNLPAITKVNTLHLSGHREICVLMPSQT